MRCSTPPKVRPPGRSLPGRPPPHGADGRQIVFHVVQAGDAEGFKNALKALVEKYPNADVTELAGEMLKGVLRGRAWCRAE